MLTEDNKKTLRERLESMRTNLMAARDREQKEAAEMSADTYEEHPLSNHMADEATDMLEQELEVGFQQSDADLLRQVEHALELMDEGKYGIDEQTGEEIPFERLQAIPYATRTVKNQSNFDGVETDDVYTLDLMPSDEDNHRLSS